uniref:F-box protein SKP2A-like n=1 Tax=Erigeron canadensis TaxID=72917 RepID=UPI001CB9266B|nr:F-box protein SKP2A-like [Erigeron canadensis]
MGQLGDEELTFIFKKLDNPDDRKSFSKVSKQLLKVSCIRLTTLHSSFPDMLFDILPTSSNLLNFHCPKPLLNHHIKLLAKSCPKLRELHLPLDENSDQDEFEFDFDDDGLCAIANGCKELLGVDLSGRLHVGDVGIVSLLRSCKRVYNLTLAGCVRVTDESLKVIGECYLEMLVLKGCYLITDLGLKYLAEGELKHYLDNLNLSECDRISDDGIIYLKEMGGLMCLNLSKCGVNVTDTGLVDYLSEFQNLYWLDLSWLVNVTDISLSVIATKCLMLVEIYLTGCQAITVEGLRAFAQHPGLEVLDLVSCHKLSWEDVKSFILTCPQLKHIHLSKRIEMSMPNRFNNCQIDWK